MKNINIFNKQSGHVYIEVCVLKLYTKLYEICLIVF